MSFDLHAFKPKTSYDRLLDLRRKLNPASAYKITKEQLQQLNSAIFEENDLAKA